MDIAFCVVRAATLRSRARRPSVDKRYNTLGRTSMVQQLPTEREPISARRVMPATDDVVELDYKIDDYPGVAKSALFGFQHVLVTFTAMVGAPLVVAKLLNLPPDMRVTIVTASMLGSGIGTMISSMGVGFVGPRLPIVMGVFFVFIGPIVSVTKEISLAAAMTAVMVGAVVQFAISPFIGRLHRFFPPIVSGTILVVIGTCLLKVAVGVAVGANTPAFGASSTLFLAALTIALIVAISRFGRGFFKSLSLFIALLIGYGAAAAFGLIDVQTVFEAPWITIPTVMPYGGFTWPGLVPIIAMVVCFLAAAGETTGHTLAVSEICGVEPTEARIRGAVSNDGFSSFASALFGGMPLTSYSQNIGAISITGVGSRYVVAFGGVFLILMSLVPKLGAIIALMPAPVLGGSLIFMFGMIAAVGISIIGKSMRSRRDMVLCAASVGIALAIMTAPPNSFDAVPSIARILLGDGIVMGIATAFALNILLPKEV
jgi:uric acid transporter